MGGWHDSLVLGATDSKPGFFWLLWKARQFVTLQLQPFVCCESLHSRGQMRLKMRGSARLSFISSYLKPRSCEELQVGSHPGPARNKPILTKSLLQNWSRANSQQDPRLGRARREAYLGFEKCHSLTGYRATPCCSMTRSSRLKWYWCTTDFLCALDSTNAVRTEAVAGDPSAVRGVGMRTLKMA